MLSQTATYALRAVIHLARQDGDGLVRVEDVAGALSVPRNYLSKILHGLARDGILDSSRGPGGGFRLARCADDILLSDVVGSFDDVGNGSGCLLGHEVCSDDDPCAAHLAWKDVSQLVQAFFYETTVADLVPWGPADSLHPVPSARSDHLKNGARNP